MTLMICFHNTLGGTVEEFHPIHPGEVKLYTCGPTVYDFPHIGNWRAYVFEDLLKRFLMFSGFRVTHVMNLTDVDDKTIRDSKARTVEELRRYTQKYIEAFMAERDVLNILPADHYPRATGHIPEMVAIIKALRDKGFAYEKDGSLYFAIDRFLAYGRLSKINLEDRRPGSRGDADEYAKESVHDFALWKAAKEGEPAWETEIGRGRPGWHIECSAMSSKYLGRTFDIHCGGVDNIFPHHENEIAQSEAANGVKFVNYWLHCHHLVVNGEKMAKSKGNFYVLKDILAKGYSRHEVRFLLLSTHYRKMLDFTEEGLLQARASLERIHNFLVDLADIKREGPAGPEVARLIEAARAGFTAGLENDLNISEALASLYSLIKSANVLKDRGDLTKADAEALRTFILLLDKSILATEVARGIVSLAGSAAADLDARGEATVLEAEFARKIEERQKARAAKDFKLADEIRKELLAEGILLEDTKDGVRWKRVPASKP
jgi:cysteinyl-tRNA synthetase